MRRLLALVLVTLGCVALTAPPAYACPRPVRPLPAQLEAAGSVFSGTVTAVTGTPGTGTEPVTYTVAVDRVFKGEVQAQTRVVSPATVARCGLQGVERRRTYLFVTSGTGAESLDATSELGTRRLSAQVRKQVIDTLGVGRLPLITEEPEEEAEEATLTRVSNAEPAGFLPVALPGVLLVAGSLLVLLLARFVGRGRSRP